MPLRSLYAESFRGLPRGVWLLSAAALVNRLGTMVVPFLALYLTQTHGYGAGEAGLVLSAYGVGAIIGAAAAGRLVQRVGPFAVQIGSLLGAAVCFVVLERLPPGPALTMGVLLAGIIVESFRPANLTALLGTCPPELHRRGFALQRLAINIGTTIAPAVGGVLALINYSLLFWADAATCVLAAAFLWRCLAAIPQDAPPAVADTDDTSSRSPWRDGAFLTVVLAVTSIWIVFFQCFATLSLDLESTYGFDEGQIGLLMALNPALIVLLEMPLVQALRNRAPLPIMALGCIAVGAGFGMHALGSMFWIPIVAMVVLTVGEMLESPTTAGFVGSRTSRGNRSRYMAIYAQTAGVALVVAPVVGTWVLERFGREVLWGGCAVVGVLAALTMMIVNRSLSGQPPSASIDSTS